MVFTSLLTAVCLCQVRNIEFLNFNLSCHPPLSFSPSPFPSPPPSLSPSLPICFEALMFNLDILLCQIMKCTCSLFVRIAAHLHSFYDSLHGVSVLSPSFNLLASLYLEWVSESRCACGCGRVCLKDADASSDLNVTKVIPPACLTCSSKGKQIVIVVLHPLCMPSLGLRWVFLFVMNLISPMLYYTYLYCIISAAHPRPSLVL